MIILLDHAAAPAEVKSLTEAIRALGLDAVPLEDNRGQALEVLGADPGRVMELAEAPGVASILTRRTALEGGEPLWPHGALRIAILAILLFVLLMLLSAFLPPGLGDPAGSQTGALDPTHDVEWYLRPLAWVYRLSGDVGRRIGGTAVLLFWVVLFLLPWIDRGSLDTPRRQWVNRIVRGLGFAVLAMFVLLALGVLS